LKKGGEMDQIPESPPQGWGFNHPQSGVLDIESKDVFEHRWRLYKARFDYAWSYFEFHAKQRTTMFNFFILFAGVVINACMGLLQKEKWLALLLVSFPAVVIVGIFVFLDRRNEELVRVGEDVLQVLEKEVLFKDERHEVTPVRRNLCGKKVPSKNKVPLGIFVREEAENNSGLKSRYEHGTWLPRIQYTIGFVFLMFTLISILHRQILHWTCWFR
jgi:hypothetical protein